MTCNMAIAFPTLACVMLCCGLMLTTVIHVKMTIKSAISGLMSLIEKRTGRKRRRFLVVVVDVVVVSITTLIYTYIQYIYIYSCTYVYVCDLFTNTISLKVQ